MKLKIDGYTTSSDRKPAFEYIEECSGEASSRIINELDNLEKYGLDFMLGNGAIKKIKTTKPPFFELKVFAENSFFRFPFVIKESIVYLLFGFKKKTNRMEQRHLKLAIKRAKEILT